MSVAKVGRGWSLVPSLVALEAEADRLAPGRRRVSDGSIGDAAHADRVSDHNPSGGWVHAIDLTDDPKGGFDAHAHARRVVARKDRRIKYVISNRRIYGPGSRFGWAGGPYSGANPHTAHAHFSVLPTSVGRFDVLHPVTTPRGSWTAMSLSATRTSVRSRTYSNTTRGSASGLSMN